jgi:xanthine/uracil permease
VGIIVLCPGALLLALGDLTAAVAAVIFGIVLVLVGAWLYPGDHPVQKLVGHRQAGPTDLDGTRRNLAIALIVLATAGSLSLVTALIMGKVAIALAASLIVSVCSGYLLMRRMDRP